MSESLRYRCDRCGRTLLAEEDVRYIVKIQVLSVYDPMEIAKEELEREEEFEDLLEKVSRLDEGSAQDSVARAFVFYLCPRCQREFVRNPLGGTEQ